MTTNLLTAPDFFRGFFGYPAPTDENVFPLRPLYDVDETDDRYVLSVDLPGVPKDRIRIEVKDASLHISAERKLREGQPKGYAKFEQSFELPQSAAFDKIEAEHQDGVLRLVIPKAASAKPRMIQSH